MKRRCQRGQALVEAALATVVLVFLSLGTIEFARAYLTWQAVSAAAHEGARRGAVLGSEAGFTASQTAAAVNAYVQANYSAALGSANLMVETEWPDGANDPGMTIRVTARQSYTPLLAISSLPSEFSGTSEVSIFR